MIFASKKDLGKSISTVLSRYFYLLLLIPLFIISYPLLEPGIIISHDFPIFDIAKTWTWVDNGSYSSLETIPRLPIIALWQIMVTIGLSSFLISKLMIVLGFFIASFSSYFAFYFLAKVNIPSDDLRLKIAAMIVSVVYSYNIWSFIRINHWYLWIGYAILPLYILFIIYSFRNPRNLKYFFISSVLWSFASTTPHMGLFYGLVFIGAFIAVILNKVIKRRRWYQLVVPLLSIIIIYSLLNAYWIYPFIEASRSHGIGPQYALNYEIGQILSRESNFLNTLRLSSEWTNLLQINPIPTSTLYPLWIFSSFSIPVLAFSALLFTRELRNTLVYYAAVIIGLLLAMGTQSPLGYYILVFLTPFGWLFRDPDKWSFLIAFGYSFLCGTCILKILNSKVRKLRHHKLVIGSFFAMLLSFIIIYNYPVYKATFDDEGTLKPVIIPSEFDALDTYLGTLAADKVFYLPYPDYIGNPNENTSTYWSGGREVPSIYQINSPKPNIEIREPGVASPSLSNYYNHLERTITQNRTNNINNFIYPLGTQYMIFHNDTLDISEDDTLLTSLHDLDGVQNIHNVGFFKIFKVGNTTDSRQQVGILNRSIAVMGGLDKFTSMNYLPSFDSRNSAILFLDGVAGEKKLAMLEDSDNVILGRSYTDLLLSLAKDMYIVKPYDATIHHEPSKLWSKAGALDPLHGDYHPYLNDIGIENWDFDYGNGLVITKAMGAKIHIPVNVEDSEIYELFLRHLENQKGGQIKIYLDNVLISRLDTLDRISNNFIWEKIGSLKLTKGIHTLTIENVGGFNALNIFALIPPDEMKRVITESKRMLSVKNGIYLMEAESSFYNNKGKDTGSFRFLFNNSKLVNSNQVSHGDDNGTVTKTYKGQFEVPSNSDLVQFHILTKNHSASKSTLSVKQLEITPSYEGRIIFSSNFEGTEVPIKNLRSTGWVNNDKDLVSTSVIRNGAINGNNSLKVNLAKTDKFGWSTISSQNIPIDENVNYNASLEISATDVKQLHSKILYLDARKKVLSDEGDYVFEGKDGNFQGAFSTSILPPKEAKYLKFRILEKSANPKDASYIVDNVKLEEIPLLTPILEKNYHNIKSAKIYNSPYYQTLLKSLPVFENRWYNYSLTTETKNTDTVSALVSFKSSLDIVENSTRYGKNASSGTILTLSNGSEISTTLDIVRPSNYTVSLRANTCPICSFMTISIAKSDKEIENLDEVKTMNIPLKRNDTALNWMYSNSTYLTAGTYELSIYSNSTADLDTVVVYQSGNSNASEFNSIHRDGKFENFFNSDITKPARISEYKKVNPTKYVIDIKQAKEPYMLSFAESYDPNWVAYYVNTDNYGNQTNKQNLDSWTDSIPLYGITNGFYLKKTGDYSLVIEYLPQKWFTIGAIISIATILLSVAMFFLLRRRIIYSDIRDSIAKLLSLISTKNS